MAFTGFNLSGASSIYYGSTPVREVWKGSTKIWPLTPPLVGVPTITNISSGFWGTGYPDDTGYMANVSFNTVQGAISYTCHFGNKEITLSVDETGGSTGDFFTYPHTGGETVNVYMTATNGVDTVTSSTVSHTITADGPVYALIDLHVIKSTGVLFWTSTDALDEDVQVSLFISPIRYKDENGNYQVYKNAHGNNPLTLNMSRGLQSGDFANMHSLLDDYSYVYSNFESYPYGQVNSGDGLFCSTYSNAGGGSKWYYHADSGQVVELVNDMAFEDLDQY